MNTVTRLGRSQIAGSVRVGVAVDALRMEEWKAKVIASLLTDPAIELTAVFVLGKPPIEGRPRLLNAYENWSAKVGAPFRMADASAMLESLPAIPLAPATNENFSEAARASIRSQNLDVLLWLASRGTLDCQGLARHGVWSFVLGTPDKSTYKPAFIREVFDREPITELLLLEHAGSLYEGRVLTRQVTATRESWYITLNATDALQNAGTMVVRRLLDVVSLPDRSTPKEVVTLSDEPASYPSTTSLLRYIGRQMGRSTAARIRARGRNLRWFVAAREGDQSASLARGSFTTKGFQRVSADIEEADPFVVEWNGQQALFVEEVPKEIGRGRISCRIFQDGKFSDPAPVIDRPYHMSYPHIFEVNGNLFMIPETSANGTVELYRCVAFPLRWELAKVLCEGVRLVDTNVLLHDGTWYFLTTALETGELLLFYSEGLDQPWIYHPRNPISMDVRSARNAGALFTMGGRLIRPAQDSSVRYGYAMTLNEVIRISRTEYEEVAIERILPTWQSGLLGTHTLSSNRHMCVVDGLELAP